MLALRETAGAADWLVVAGRPAVADNHPVGDDEFAALVVTLWRRR